MARILVIDDDEQVRMVLAEFLKSEGHVPLTACDGEEGLGVIQRDRVDLVITDILMPRKEGIETIIEIRNLRPELKIIAMSGGGLTEGTPYLSFARQLGADAVLDKPVRREAFSRAVSACLDNPRPTCAA